MAKTQMLSFPIGLPDGMQAQALRLLDASRPAINDIIEDLWPKLDEFAGERTGVAYRQIGRPVFLDSGGLDGRQARLRREIDRLKACRERYVKLVKAAVIARVEHQKPLPAHFVQWQAHIEAYEARIKRGTEKV